MADVCSEYHGGFFEPFAGGDKVDSSESRVDSGGELSLCGSEGGKRRTLK
jgi:hypothetical protein